MSPEERADALCARIIHPATGMFVDRRPSRGEIIAAINAAVAEAEQTYDHAMAMLHGRRQGEDWTAWAKRRQAEWNARVDAAVVETKEACAKEVEKFGGVYDGVLKDIAAAIRSRT